MDKLDRKLYHDLSIKMEIPKECENIIKRSLDVKKQPFSLFKIVSTVCACLFFTAGIVYAGTKVYNKIWKEPEKLVGFYTENNNSNVTVEEKKNILSETDAKEKANELLRRFGHENEKIKSMELFNNPSNYELHWIVETNKKTRISFNANGNTSFNISVDDILYSNIESYRTTEKDAKNIAKDLCKKYGYDSSKYSHIKITSNMGNENESYIWYVEFYKDYDGILNPYENICISFIPEINQLYYFAVNDEGFENNPIEVTKEQAKNIALKEETKISPVYDIKDISINLGIVASNSIAYFRTTDYAQYRSQTTTSYPFEKRVDYRIEQHIRRSWLVTIYYDIPNSTNNINDKQFCYYIDATTGEVIGGNNILDTKYN